MFGQQDPQTVICGGRGCRETACTTAYNQDINVIGWQVVGQIINVQQTGC
ncbi:hypothetical protein GCM10022249_15780 [Enteractinococcus coprophilus]